MGDLGGLCGRAGRDDQCGLDDAAWLAVDWVTFEDGRARNRALPMEKGSVGLHVLLMTVPEAVELGGAVSIAGVTTWWSKSCMILGERGSGGDEIDIFSLCHTEEQG